MLESSPLPSGHSDRLADYAAGLELRDLPARVVAALKMSILDTLGCGLFGADTPWGRILADFACRRPGEAPVWGSGRRGFSHYAAMANATMAHGFELDDLHPGSRSHPGAVMVPMVLAMRPGLGPVSGAEMIAAMAAGYEVQGRVGIAQGVSSFKRGWHPTGTAGAFGAAVCAGRLLKLSPGQMIHAMGIAGTMPAGLMAAQFGAMVKRFYVGHAAWAGLVGAELAQAGFTGIPDIFDAPYGGYLDALSDGARIDGLSEGLGSRYEAAEIGVKFWPCVGTNQSLMDAMAEICAATGFAAEDVAGIEVVTTPYQKLHSGWDYEPGSVMGAQMSMKYCIAALICEGQLTVDEFTEAKIAAPRVLDLTRRIAITADPALEGKPGHERFARVTLTLKDGSSHSAERVVARGSPRNPAGWEDVAAKFRDLAGRVLPKSNVDALVDLVARLETLPDIALLDAQMTKFPED